MTRALCCCALLAAVAAGGEETRLGTLIRWYLHETSPSRRQDLLEAIERVTAGDPAKVAAAIRNGEHFEHSVRPRLARGGKHPEFDRRRPRLRDVSGCAGDFAALYLPRDYTPERAWPLYLELSPTGLFGQPPGVKPPSDAILVFLDVSRHRQARTRAGAAEMLVLSLLAHLFDTVHVDPDRVFLHGGVARTAALAYYIALHNPDRFAGVLGVRGVWADGLPLAPHGATLSCAAVEKHGGDRTVETFLKALPRYPEAHLHLRAREERGYNEVLVPRIRTWHENTVRPAAPESLALVTDRGQPLRSYWVRMVPRVPSEKAGRDIGRRSDAAIRPGWRHRIVARPSRLDVVVGPDNNLDVQSHRVVAFDVFVDPAFLDADKVLRVRINGRVPEARVIDLDVGDLLEDYRRRRDPRLLYACRLTFKG